MARDENYTLSVPATASTDLGFGDGPGIGKAQRSRDLTNKVVEVSGTFTGPVAVQTKVKNAWVTVDSLDGSSSPSVIEISYPCDSVRVDVTSVVTGTPVCVLAGVNQRADG